MAHRRWTTKSWKSKRGIRHGGHPFTTASVIRLLTNVIYAGQVEYRGMIYPGEHQAIVDPGLWKAVNTDLRDRRPPKTESTRGQQNALLAGLLFCKSCERPMIATYTAKGGRRYHYYVCQGARQKGWMSCPTKSVPASLIEDSLVSQLRTQLNDEETRLRLNLPEPDWQVFVEGEPTRLVPTVVEKLRYDGATGMVSVKLRTPQGSLSGAQQ